MKRTELMSGVNLNYVQSDKFKTSLLSVNLLRPLRLEEVSLNALLPLVLRRGTEKYPDIESLSAALDELYGAEISTAVRKKGEIQCIGFVADFLDDAYTQDSLLEEVAALTGELLLRPALRDGGFYNEYVEGEKTNLIDGIESIKNDKSQFAQMRLVESMCAGEAFGISKLGSVETVGKIDALSLYENYKRIISSSQVELYYCGNADELRVIKAFKAMLKELPRGVIDKIDLSEIKKPTEIKNIEESADSTQGNLAIGLRTSSILTDEDYPALVLFNSVYGGSVTSKLFMTVREALSLCYRINSGVEKHKGVMLISCGIEGDKLEPAKNEILAQLEACRNGEIEQWELEAAREAIISALKTAMDSQGRLEDFYLSLAIADGGDDPEQLAEKLKTVTLEQVVRSAKETVIDTIYFLKPEETPTGEQGEKLES